MRNWRPENIEKLTRKRLREYELISGNKIPWPRVPIELVIENQPFDLIIKWETIEERPGETILAALRPDAKQIVLNECYRELFTEKPGLERFSLGHELGHWDLFCSKRALGEDLLPGLELNYQPVFRNSGQGIVQVFIDLATSKHEAYEMLRDFNANPRRDSPLERWAVDRYSASLLMPRDIVALEVQGLDLTQWPTLYQVAERFSVTATACRVRLEELGVIYARDGKLFRSREEYSGQLTLNI